MDVTAYKARDIMREPIIISKNTRISEAIERILNQGIGSLIVVDNNVPIGIITKRDLLWAITYNKRNPEIDTVEKIMSRNLIIARPEDDLLTILNKMLNNNISHLPVVENNKVIGIITDGDLIEIMRDFIEITISTRPESEVISE